jgi:hypothetical protein
LQAVVLAAVEVVVLAVCVAQLQPQAVAAV